MSAIKGETVVVGILVCIVVALASIFLLAVAWTL